MYIKIESGASKKKYQDSIDQYTRLSGVGMQAIVFFKSSPGDSKMQSILKNTGVLGEQMQEEKLDFRATRGSSVAGALEVLS